MGLTKTEIFTPEQNKLAALAKAIAHPARIAIIQHLIKVNTCICGDLVDEIGLAQATISQHLKALKESGLIQGNIESPRVCYCINTDMFREVKHLFDSFFSKTNNGQNCC